MPTAVLHQSVIHATRNQGLMDDPVGDVIHTTPVTRTIIQGDADLNVELPRTMALANLTSLHRL